MPGGWVTWTVLLVVGDFFFVLLIMRATIGQTFRTLADRYPATQAGPHAVRKNFQSFRFGLVNAGLSVHVEVDDTHLHLKPARFLRWAGAVDSSIPWEAVQPGKRHGKYRKARIDATSLIGPSWALDLAESATTPD